VDVRDKLHDLGADKKDEIVKSVIWAQTGSVGGRERQASL